MGFAVSAIALSLVVFLRLLGAEKAILALVLGVLAVHGSAPGAMARKLENAALCIGFVFVASLRGKPARWTIRLIRCRASHGVS